MYYGGVAAKADSAVLERLFKVVESRKGKRVPFPPIGYTKTGDSGAEVPRDRANFELLQILARATGGQINAVDEMSPPKGKLVRFSTPLQMYPILAAALLFLLEIFARRFVLS